MAVQQERPPAYSHDLNSLELPSVPRDELLVNHAAAAISLPNFRSLGLPEATHGRNPTAAERARNDSLAQSAADLQQWQAANSLQFSFPRVPSTAPRSSADVASPKESIMSDEEHTQRPPSVVSMDDPDVRMAAEALSGLGNPDFVCSPSSRSVTLPLQSSSTSNTQYRPHQQDPEPLLSLVMSSHPWLGGAINGSLSAYDATKHYSPRFIRSSAEFVERNIGSPVANTVGSVSRRTGVEGRVRRYLGDRRPSDLDVNDNAQKRRRVAEPGTEDMDVEKGLQSPATRELRSRAESQASFAESLPAYDDNRSPQYEEHSTQIATGDAQDREQDRPPHWSTQLIISTSGLGAALSETSLRSLKHCLRLLHTSADHLASVMRALKLVLEDYERNSNPPQQDNDRTNPAGVSNMDAGQEEVARRIADSIKSLSDDIWQTLQGVVNSVSRYTGGALPSNAAHVVRQQLMSVPQRWRVASQSTAESAQDSEAVRGAHRMLAFAREGLEMMAQVTLVVGGTVSNAEQWLDSLGRRRRDASDMSSQGLRIEEEKRGLVTNGNFENDSKLEKPDR